MYERHKYSDNLDKISNVANAVYSSKHDGANYFMVVGPDGYSRFISRRQDVKGGYPDRTSKVPHLAQVHLPDHIGHVYNVELIHTGHSPDGKDNHPKISGILNSLPAKAIATQDAEGPVRAKVFDVISPIRTTYASKLEDIKKLVHDFGNTALLSQPEMAFGHEDGALLAKKMSDEKREGVVVTSLTEPEHSNLRYKIKHFAHYNVKVSKINQEFDKNGVAKDQMGSVEVVDATGRVVGTVSGFNTEDKRDAWLRPERWVNRLIQARALPPTATQLRHAVYNGDADGDIDTVHALK